MAEQIDNDIEQVISMVPRDGEETCEPCKVDNNIQLAVGWCETCDEQLCSDCYKIHCRPTILRNHQLMSLEAMGNRKNEQKIINRCWKLEGHRSCSGGASLSRVTATSSECKEVKSLEVMLSDLGKRLTTIEEKTETNLSISKKLTTSKTYKKSKKQMNIFRTNSASPRKCLPQEKPIK